MLGRKLNTYPHHYNSLVVNVGVLYHHSMASKQVIIGDIVETIYRCDLLILVKTNSYMFIIVGSLGGTISG
jgi:hypothetical protein